MTEYNKKMVSKIIQRKNFSENEKILEAGKIITEIESIDVQEGFNKVSKRINQKDKIRLIFAYTQRIAAILFIPILLISIWSLLIKLPQVENAQLAMQEVSCPPGTRTNLELSDGTKMWLNSESSARFPVAFAGNTRNIEVVGEAYFEVVKDTKKPFIVSSENTHVEVLGTSFNVRTYKNDKNIEVVLKEGKVLFKSNFNNNRQRSVMQAGNRAIVEKETGKMTLMNVNVDNYLAWHENVLVFDDSPIDEFVRKLERWYGIDVTISDDNLKDYRFTTKFKDEPLQHVLELIQLSSPVDIKYIPPQYSLDGDQHIKPQVIITKK